MELRIIVAILWAGYVWSSMTCGTFLMSMPADQIRRGVSASDLRVDAVLNGLLIYGGISAIVFWLVAGWPGLVVGGALGPLCALRMEAAIDSAEQMARS